MTNAELSRRITAFYRGWHDWTEATRGYEAAKFVVIDDLAPRGPATKFSRLEEVRAELSELLDAAASWAGQDDELRQYSYTKLKQSLSYLNQTPDTAVAREDVERRGTRWVELKTERLEALVAEMRACRASLNRAGTDESALSDYHDARLDNETVPAIIRRYAEVWLPRLYAHKQELARFEFETEAVRSPGTWRNMVVHDGSKFILRVNVASQVRYTRGVAESLALHEICGHMVHLQQLSRSSRILEAAPELLCIAIHGQDSSFAEGVAQFIPIYLAGHVCREPAPINGELLNFELNFAVRHKNIIDLIRGASSVEDAVALHARFMPGDDSAGPFYVRVVNDPFFACQILNYTSSLDDFKPILKNGNLVSLDKMFDRMMDGFYGHESVASLARTLR